MKLALYCLRERCHQLITLPRVNRAAIQTVCLTSCTGPTCPYIVYGADLSLHRVRGRPVLTSCTGPTCPYIVYGADLSLHRVRGRPVLTSCTGPTCPYIVYGADLSLHRVRGRPVLTSCTGPGPRCGCRDFQDNNDGLSAHWDFTGDPCPIDKYEWGIFKFDGTVIVNMTELPAGWYICT